MSQPALDLTGRWHGIFNYPDDTQPNAFDAELRDVDGTITGETCEPSDGADDVDPDQRAFIEGIRTGHAVRFVKRYDELHRDPVHYDGTVDPEATEIGGTWTIQGVWSGSFIMIRPAAQSVAEEVAVETPVEQDRPQVGSC